MHGTYRYQHDALPEAPLVPHAEQTPVSRAIRRIRLNIGPPRFQTPKDTFGRYQVYRGQPQSIPDSTCELENMSNVPEVLRRLHEAEARSLAPSDAFYPCPNISTFLLEDWHWKGGAHKSKSDRAALVNDVLLDPRFSVKELEGVNWNRLDDKLAGWTGASTGPTWSISSVSVSIPPQGAKAALDRSTNPSSGDFPVEFQSRKLTDIIRDRFENNNPQYMHYEPYESRCQSANSSTSQRLYGEGYESDQMIKDHAEVQNVKLDPPCDLPRCVAEIMIFSDELRLAQFGRAKAWPILLSFANISKYERCRPNSQTWQEVAFLPSLPSEIQDSIRVLNDGRAIPKYLMTHLRRELFHAVWNHLLDDDFLRAWRNGIVIKCADGITRRVFPRIFSYSADYPERVLAATIRGLNSLCPCPTCFVSRGNLDQLGRTADKATRCEEPRIDTESRVELVRKARELIYSEGKPVNHKAVEDLLRPGSLVPTLNAFSRRLQPLGYNFFAMFTVDPLHEVEIGVWKAVFKHIIRILHTQGSKVIAEFNARFREVPTFGQGTIRKFSENVSEMTRPAARNYEDVLQCCIPVLEGLLPPSFEAQVMRLLFIVAQWHALAKLRSHSERTLKELDKQTRVLGKALRDFRDYTTATPTYETPKEHNARLQRLKKKGDPGNQEPSSTKGPSASQQKRRKRFNVQTCKTHFLGDYSPSIRRLGTTDSVSTQTGELHHKRIKRRYIRTNKDKPLGQITRIERIEANLQNMRERLAIDPEHKSSSSSSRPARVRDNEPTPMQDAGSAPYVVARSQKNSIVLPTWLKDNRNDPAFTGFMIRLKNHLFARLTGRQYQEEAANSDAKLASLTFHSDRIFQHRKIKINYTSYDVRRCQDIIRPNTPKCFALVPSAEDPNSDTPSHPFWYAKVLGVFHANIIFGSGAPRRMDFLWVRWLGRNLEESAGWGVCRLDTVGYFTDTYSDHAFDFVDPADVIRAAHLIPRFKIGRTLQYLGPEQSVASDTSDGDWDQHCVNRFVDRDMFIRYLGFGTGHLNSTPPADYISPSSPLPTEDTVNLVQVSKETQPESAQLDALPNGSETKSTSSDEESDFGESDDEELECESGSDSNSDSDSDSDADDYAYN